MALADGGGVEVSTEGDSFFAVFTDPLATVVAAVDMQRGLDAKLSTESEPVLVRCGIHTGVGVLGSPNYSGMDVHKASPPRLLRGQRWPNPALGCHRPADRERLPAGLGLVNVGRYRLEGFTQSDTLHQVSGPGLKNEFRPVRASRPKSRLPMPLTEFVGREGQLTAIETAVAGHRLVTLTGPGGTGKTRMAIELGHRLESSYDDGVAFVSLATVNDQSLIPSAILEVLELKTAGGVEPIEHLVRYLADREILLILDNLEQLTTGVQVLALLLEEAPALKVVATSRTPLRIAGEREVPVPPLDVPDVGSGQEKALQTAGVRLFADRAAAVRPGFEVDAGNFETVAGIARSVDGLPLAIGLASILIILFYASVIHQPRGRTPHLLVSHYLSRHRSLSMPHRLERRSDSLSQLERLLFEQLSVFSGGFGLSEAEQVCRDHPMCSRNRSVWFSRAISCYRRPRRPVSRGFAMPTGDIGGSGQRRPRGPGAPTNRLGPAHRRVPGSCREGRGGDPHLEAGDVAPTSRRGQRQIASCSRLSCGGRRPRCCPSALRGSLAILAQTSGYPTRDSTASRPLRRSPGFTTEILARALTVHGGLLYCEGTGRNCSCRIGRPLVWIGTCLHRLDGEALCTTPVAHELLRGNRRGARTAGGVVDQPPEQSGWKLGEGRRLRSWATWPETPRIG